MDSVPMSLRALRRQDGSRKSHSVFAGGCVVFFREKWKNQIITKFLKNVKKTKILDRKRKRF